VDEQQGQEHVELRLLEAPTVRDYLDDFALRAGRHLGTRTEVSISLRHAGTDRLAASTSERAARCDEVEYATGAGPCITAMDLMQVVLVPDLVDDTRWESWRRAAIDAGFRSGAGVPAHVAEGVEIVLNLYSEDLDPWDADLLVRADTYAQQVAVTVGLCLQVAHLSAAYADAQAAVRDLQRLNDLMVRAVSEDEAAAPELLRRVRDAARAGDAGADDAVRSILREASAGGTRSDAGTTPQDGGSTGDPA
jgi:GAF domain-containing protein